MRILFFGLLLIFSGLVSAQEYRYDFKIEDVSEPGTAKSSIESLRDLLGVTIIKFDDEIDQFSIFTHLDFDVEETILKLEINGITINGTIVKINLE